jgi:hypothetical protein
MSKQIPSVNSRNRTNRERKAMKKGDKANLLTRPVTPNVEVTGARRRGVLAARRSMDNERIAARVPCRSASG